MCFFTSYSKCSFTRALCNTQDPPLHFASFGAEGVLATASVEGHVVKVWPPMTPQAGLPVQPQTRLEVGVSKDTPQPGIIHRSATILLVNYV